MALQPEQEFEAAVRLQRLSRHSRLLARARGRRVAAGLAFIVLPLTLTSLMASSILERSRLAGASAILIVLLMVIAVQVVSDRLDALLEILESSGIVTAEPPRRDV